MTSTKVTRAGKVDLRLCEAYSGTQVPPRGRCGQPCDNDGPNPRPPPAQPRWIVCGRPSAKRNNHQVGDCPFPNEDLDHACARCLWGNLPPPWWPKPWPLSIDDYDEQEYLPDEDAYE